MKLAFYIARRYLVSRKSANIVNLISAISVVGVAIGTMALIVVLSAFNGIDSFIEGMLSNFDPDLKITAVQGKSFSLDDADFDSVKQLTGVVSYAEVVEENALLSYEGRLKYAVVKGVATDYAEFSGLDSVMIDGEFFLKKGSQNYAVIGEGVRYELSVGLSFVSPIYVNVPRRDFRSTINIDQSLNRGHVFPSGSFSVEQEIDSKYILVPLDFARSLFELEGRLTSLELKVDDQDDVSRIKASVQKLLGAQFLVQDRYEQHEFLYRVMRSEKWSSFLILSFILVIASFNLLGSLTMIIIDKKDDIKILGSMGANKKLVRQIFLFEGWLVSFSGAVGGLILGVVLVWAQSRFELLKLPGDGSFALSAYPVDLQLIDVSATFLIVLCIGFFAAWYPVRSISSDLT
ncbi:FtsX-like permease family protein [uncultured Sunxiuqinia sp.]|uniref:ABC transporter permease n=1 Tax=uncultured Sunxiuqinia sp. TaxID=1573825 RepID=UPI0030DAAECB